MLACFLFFDGFGSLELVTVCLSVCVGRKKSAGLSMNDRTQKHVLYALCSAL